MTSREQKSCKPVDADNNSIEATAVYQNGLDGKPVLLAGIPTPVPLEPREWLAKRISERGSITIAEADSIIEQGWWNKELEILTEYSIYSSHVNAALMADYEKQNSVMHNLSEKLQAAESSNAALMEKLAEAEKNAVLAAIPISMLYRIATHAKPGFEGHSAVWNWEEAERVTWEKIDQAKAAESQLSTTQEALRNVKFIASESGHAPCRSGGIGEEGVCPNTCFCEWAKKINAIVERVLSPPTKLDG